MATQKYSAEDMATALRDAKGMVTVAASKLGCSQQTIRNYAARYASVQTAIDESREQMLDVAELQLAKQINSGNISAIIFYLKTIGKRRGYIERSEVVNFNVDSALAAKLMQAFEARGLSASDVFEAMLTELSSVDSAAGSTGNGK